MIGCSLFLRLKGVEDAELYLLVVVDIHVFSAAIAILDVSDCLIQTIRQVATMGPCVLFCGLIVQHFWKMIIVMLIHLLVVFVIEMNISYSRLFLLFFCTTIVIASWRLCFLHKEWLRDWITLVWWQLFGYYNRLLNCKRFLLLNRISIRLLLLLLLVLMFRRILNLCLQYFIMNSSWECIIVLLLDITHGRSTFLIHC